MATDMYAQMLDSYLEALLSHDRAAASRIVLQAVDGGAPIEHVLLSVIQAAQYELGRLWENNRITVAQEHYCSAVAQLIMSGLYERFPRRPSAGGKLVAACVDEELHEIGVRMVADFFELAGWETYYIGANTPSRTVREAVREYDADIVCVSVTMNYHLSTARGIIKSLTEERWEKPVTILVGGYALNAASALWKGIGAHGWAPDAREAVRIGSRLHHQSGQPGGHDGTHNYQGSKKRSGGRV